MKSTSTCNTYNVHTRLSNAPVQHQLCLLCIDEIYAAKKIDYGLIKDGKSAKSVLAFLIQSVCCKYKDIVKLVPMDNLTGEILLNQFNAVMKILAEIQTLKIIGISAAMQQRTGNFSIYKSN